MSNWIDDKLQEADYNTLDKIRDEVVEEEKSRKENRGGARKGAGRPKGIETTTMRVPKDLKHIIENFIKMVKRKQSIKNHDNETK